MADPLQQLEADFREEVQNFDKRHPAFRDALTALGNVLRDVFSREKQDERPGWFVIWGLARLAVEDFDHVLLFAVCGYGFGASKLLRPLYERVVTVLYLMRHPEELPNFNDTADADARRFVNHVENTGFRVRDFITDQQVTDLKDAYAKVKARLDAKRCPHCHRGSWTDRDPRTQAQEVGLDRLYVCGSFWPTLLLHTTRIGLDARIDISTTPMVFKGEPLGRSPRHHCP